jgi:hypothetical protein
MINSLTEKQEASFSQYRDEWIAYGLDTSPVNEVEAIAAVKLAYLCANIPEPKYFLFTDGPTEAMQLLTLVDKVTLTQADFDRLTKLGPMALTNEIKAQVSEIYDKPKPAVIWPAFYGQHDAGWLAAHQFFADNFELSEKSAGLRAIGKHCGWVWLYQDLVIISRKPLRVSINGQRQLHNEKMAAIEYADGTKVYAFNGVAIPEQWVLERDTMDPTNILQHTDTDVRAAGVALFGYSKLKHALNYKVLEGDPSTDMGALVELTIPGLTRKGRFLEAVCPRNGPVFLGVPNANPWDNGAAIVDALGAQAFLARLPRSAYEHPPIRT